MTTEIKFILSKIWKIRLSLRAEGDKLWAEGNKLWAEGNKLWAECIIEFCGNIKLKWNWISTKNNYNCELETGEIFES